MIPRSPASSFPNPRWSRSSGAGGPRVNAAVTPVTFEGPMLSIRKPRRDPVRGQDLVRDLTLTAEMLGMLEACVRARLNILISGGLGAGKTTPPDALGRGEAGMRQLVFHGLLMRPDRVVVDELLGGEALDLLWATDAHHPGAGAHRALSGWNPAGQPRDRVRGPGPLLLHLRALSRGGISFSLSGLRPTLFS